MGDDGDGSSDESFVYSDEEEAIERTLGVLGKNNAKVSAFKQETDDESDFEQETDDEEVPTPAVAETTTIIATFQRHDDKYAHIQVLETQKLKVLAEELSEANGERYPFQSHCFVCKGEKYKYSDMVDGLKLKERDVLSLKKVIEKGRGSKRPKMTPVLRLTVVNKVCVPWEESWDDKTFPRKRRERELYGLPGSYQEYLPPVTSNPILSLKFSHLHDWIFRQEASGMVTADIFKAETGKNYGFGDVNIPAEPRNLTDWLECLNQGLNAGKSVVVIPPGVEHGCEDSGEDAIVVKDRPDLNLEVMYPKIAALAGFKHDEKVPRGWISCAMQIGGFCSVKVYSGSAWGAYPVWYKRFDVKGGINEIGGLDDLFRMVEGLLRTL